MKKVTNDELSESDEVKPSKKKGTNAIVQQVYLLYFPKKNTFVTQQTNTNKQKYLSFSKKHTRIISIISQHFLTINCFKSILKTNGLFNYFCKEIIFVFLTEFNLI